MRNLIGVAAALGASLYLATPIPASAGSTNQGPGWGTVVGAGILGGMLGAASAPAAPQPQIIIIEPPAAAAPPPQPPPPQSEPHSWWCTGSQRWYPDVQTCTAGIWTNQVPQPPPQAHRAQPAQKVIHAPISSCIGVSVSVAGDRLTLINKCGQAATVTWGSGLTQDQVDTGRGRTPSILRGPE